MTLSVERLNGPEIGDMDEGIVKRRKDTRHAEDKLSLADLRMRQYKAYMYDSIGSKSCQLQGANSAVRTRHHFDYQSFHSVVGLLKVSITLPPA